MHLHLYEAAVGAVAALAVPAAIIGMNGEARKGIPLEVHPMIEIAETVLDYPLPGEFLAGGTPARNSPGNG